MAHPVQRWLVRLGSVTVLLVVILLVSADAETAWALAGFGVAVYAGTRLAGKWDIETSVRARLGPQWTRILWVVLAGWLVVAITDQAVEALFVTGGLLTGYVGYRSGRVLRGGLYGAVFGIVAAVAFLFLIVVSVLLAGVFGIEGARGLLLKSVLAAPMVGFFGILAALYVTAVGGVVGLVSGGTGGAIARLSQREK